MGAPLNPLSSIWPWIPQFAYSTMIISVAHSPPVVKSLQDLTIIEAWDSETNAPKYVTFYYINHDEHVYFGQSSKNKRDITLDEYSAALKPVRDDELYPTIPTDVSLTIAPADLDDHTAFVKRPGFVCYEEMKGTSYIPSVLLNETIIMETISELPHPNIVKYYGCRIQRGRITAIVLEQLEWTLTQYVHMPDFQQLSQVRFIADLQSAVDHLHSLGLAHNDISPDNIMIRNGQPILIDLGSCQPFGNHLQSLGTLGWCKETFFTSEQEHDAYSMDKLRTWLQDPEWTAGVSRKQQSVTKYPCEVDFRGEVVPVGKLLRISWLYYSVVIRVQAKRASLGRNQSGISFAVEHNLEECAPLLVSSWSLYTNINNGSNS